jgi:two-component system, NtrC family, sensor kinase
MSLRGQHRRSVAARVLLAYAIVAFVFALVVGWSVIALGQAARDADLMRSGYLPLARAVRDLVSAQDTWNTQLNHVTTVLNPADKRVWFDTAVRIGRPKKFAEVRAAISRAFEASGDSAVRAMGSALQRETSAIEQELEQDPKLLAELFDGLQRGQSDGAERLRDRLVTRGYQATRGLLQLDRKVMHNVDVLNDQARLRERLALRLLLASAAFSVLFGVAVALYARRVLRPLGSVTERAKAVAKGDLTPRAVLASNDEIGELAGTFESMVAAIARANEQLLASERLAAIGKMAAHVTHEIRNPLSSIALNVELLEEEFPAAESEGRALLRAIKNEVERLTGLSAQYLSVARKQPPRLEVEDLGEIVAEAHEFMRRELQRRHVESFVRVEDGLPYVRVDEAQLKQALYNLITNASDAMPSGGRLSLAVARTGDGVAITVDDEGSGMDEATRQRLFEPFFTTKSHGTGLGLAITRQIIQTHGGRIDCSSRAEGGTRFTIHLPACEDSSAVPGPVSSPPSQHVQGD